MGTLVGHLLEVDCEIRWEDIVESREAAEEEAIAEVGPPLARRARARCIKPGFLRCETGSGAVSAGGLWGQTHGRASHDPSPIVGRRPRMPRRWRTTSLRWKG